MTDLCEHIEELLMDYINRNLTKEENSRIILHLSSCKSCQKEMAELILLKKQLQLSMSEVPKDVRDSAYAKLPQKSRDLEDILQSKSPFMAFELLDYTLAPVKQTIRLALQGL
ncbi:MAG: hypothetical protein K0S76_2992 [Herbinix sp.]|jgi:predicted anti-sigma-YlaC factor YlaD|nr:hypothetical protein [Herbinix sp.]